MIRHPSHEVLNDYIDAQLPEAERRSVESHLGACADCARTVGELQALVDRARALPGIEPSLDLLPGIRRAVTKPPTRWVHWAAVAAALVVAFIGAQWLGRDDVDIARAPDEAVPIAVLMAEFRAAEDQYILATDRLMQGLEQGRGEIPPETLVVIDENLRIIDSAIAEVRLSLDREGVNPGNGHALTALYSKKLQILWRASRLWS